MPKLVKRNQCKHKDGYCFMLNYYFCGGCNNIISFWNNAKLSNPITLKMHI